MRRYVDMQAPGAHSLRVGVCSWSLRPAGPHELTARVRAAGLSAVQLALDPLRRGEWSVEETLAALRSAGIQLLSGMMRTRGEDYTTIDSIRRTGGLRSDEHWEENLNTARDNAALAARLGLALVTLHVGFLAEEGADGLRAVMLERLCAVCDAFGRVNVRVGLETGQEPAETLRAVLSEATEAGARNVGVNFDPANMLLYGTGDPVAALELLLPHVFQVHIKDARPSPAAGAWGRETPVGQGAVDWKAFFGVLRARCPECPLVIEREAGLHTVDDVRAAAALVDRYLGVPGEAR
jgi:L-ribulose-5-phosphate 3-epimerase